jgi:phytoene dehydrogenase-like protein
MNSGGGALEDSGMGSGTDRNSLGGTMTGRLTMSSNEYDVVVLGGGLAGLTLALQLKRQRPETSIFVAERREGPAPQAAFKVGESTVEVGADYFGRVCGMLNHIERDQLLKAGLRSFSRLAITAISLGDWNGGAVIRVPGPHLSARSQAL